MSLHELHLEWSALNARKLSGEELSREELERLRTLAILIGNARSGPATLDDLARQVRAAGQDEIPTSRSLPVSPTTPAPPPRSLPTEQTLRIHEARVEEALQKLDAITDDEELRALKHEARELLTILYGLAAAPPECRDLVALEPEEKAVLYARVNRLCDRVQEIAP